MEVKMSRLSAIDVANYFLILMDREEGDSITHLKLQKLLYFAQGTSLALTDNLLFNESLKAWNHGPVISSVYSFFKVFDKSAIPNPSEMNFDIYDETTKHLIYKVYSVYGEHTASYLRNLSHKHTSWQKAFNSYDKTLDYSDVKTDFTQESIIRDLDMSDSDLQAITDAEDRWWMEYDCGEPSEDITEHLVEQMRLFKKDKNSFINSCVEIEGF
jgi:uncharacterized phage-associated protein